MNEGDVMEKCWPFFINQIIIGHMDSKNVTRDWL